MRFSCSAHHSQLSRFGLGVELHPGQCKDVGLDSLKLGAELVKGANVVTLSGGAGFVPLDLGHDADRYFYPL